MPLRIKINNLNKKRKIGRRRVEKTVKSVLRHYRRKNAFVEITFMTNRKIAVLNKKYMARSGPTDVLSFLLSDRFSSEKKKLIGDIYISSDMAASNARKFKTTLQKELVLYATHGALHLIGFGDKTRREKNRMRKEEQRFLRKILP